MTLKNRKYEKKAIKFEPNNEIDNDGDIQKTADNGTDMLSSFYTADIDLVRNNVKKSDKISKYIEALSMTCKNKIEIDTNIQEMKKWVAPLKYRIAIIGDKNLWCSIPDFDFAHKAIEANKYDKKVNAKSFYQKWNDIY